jgi:hypothetical protein
MCDCDKNDATGDIVFGVWTIEGPDLECVCGAKKSQHFRGVGHSIFTSTVYDGTLNESSCQRFIPKSQAA